jgi:hypothetical protein
MMVVMAASPLTDFMGNPTSGTLPLIVQFADSSTIQKGKISTWEWDFGDGNFSPDQNPTHTYHSSGTFTVKLRTISDAGCEDTLVKTNYIHITNGIKTQINSKQVKFYPNPANSKLYVEYSGYGAANLILTDVLGNTHLQTTIIPGKNELNVTNCKPGIYFIFLDGMVIGKLLIE